MKNPLGVRELFGFCDHRWKPLQPGKMIELSVGLAQGFGEKIVTGYVEPRECSKCGAVKGFRL